MQNAYAMQSCVNELMETLAAFINNCAQREFNAKEVADEMELQQLNIADAIKVLNAIAVLQQHVNSTKETQEQLLSNFTSTLNMLDTNVRDEFANAYTTISCFYAGELE
jgi:predicted transcriptional regulator